MNAVTNNTVAENVEVKGEETTMYPECTNCGINALQMLEQQNFAEENGEEVPERCCGIDDLEQLNQEDTRTEEEKLDLTGLVEEPGELELVVERPKEEEKKTMNSDALMAMIQKLTDELNELKGTNVTKVKKNQRPGKAAAGRKYVLLSATLNKWGKVPQQQADIADLLTKNFKIGEEVTEDALFTALVDNAGDYASIYSSKQDPTYLFRYYRGLKNDGKHAGFIARNFIKQIG
jgi:hypothetical protein